MSIGATLAKAREAAGLTVADVSSRTRIRTPLIRAIEADDFGQCGGDFYARGHIRAISRVVGVDSRPLITEYDTRHPDSAPVGLDDLFLPPPTAPEPPARDLAAPGPERAEAAEAGHVSFPEPAPAETSPPAPEPAPAAGQEQHPSHARPHQARRFPASLVMLAVVALAVIGGGAYQLASASGTRHGSATASGPAPRRGGVLPSSPAPRSPSATAPSPSASPSPSPTPTAVQTVQVTPSSASVTGPNGGDNGAEASRALAGNPGSPWHTDWYTSASFGNLQSGTGLMLALPRTVAATGITVKFGDYGGAMQVKAGTSPGSLRTVTTTGSAGGTTTLSFGKTSARYIELWFTRLGRNSNGYQVAVYDVSVRAVQN